MMIAFAIFMAFTAFGQLVAAACACPIVWRESRMLACLVGVAMTTSALHILDTGLEALA